MASVKNLLKFPKHFKIGFASASYQIEGAWNSGGKGENIWDRFTHTAPNKIADQSNGDLAADSYNKYKDDIAMIKFMGGEVYRFSISWSRLLPSGFVDSLNPVGVKYYNDVTLYHWDLPQPLQDLGGWTNECLVEYFADYARVAFRLFGDRVKKWITFNEPWELCYLGYGIGMFAPGVKGNGVAEYLAGHNVIKSHARAYHLYAEEFRNEQQGVVGMSFNTMGYEPKTSDPDDVAAAKRHFDFVVGWFAHPIYSKAGDYPNSMKEAVAANSKAEGFPRSRLPVFDDFWLSYIQGTADFYGLNHYTTQKISNSTASGSPSWKKDSGTSTSQDESWPRSASVWFRVVPHGFRAALKFIKEEYNNPVIFVTENGFSDRGELEDTGRISYFNSYLKEMLKAIHLDGVNVQLYTAWTLLDDFEWIAGYTERFGIISVDFKDPERKRTPKKSASYFQKIIADRQIFEEVGV